MDLSSDLLLKLLHILGTLLFLGNMGATAFWKAMADRSKNWQIIRFSQRLITYTNVFFTVMSVALIAITGWLMAKYFQNPGGLKWLIWEISFFLISLLIWIIILIPVQIKLHRIMMTHKFQETEIPFQYWAFERVWMMFGAIAAILTFLSLCFMVLLFSH